MIRKMRLPFLAVVVLLASGGFCLAFAGDLRLRDNVGITDISGGEQSNSSWSSQVGNDEFRKALKRSLDSAGLLERARGEGRYTLDAVLESVEQPGADFAATTRVKYVLTDKDGGKQIFHELISGEYAMAVWDSFMNPKVDKKLNEGAVRANIGKLIERLLHLGGAPEETALAK